MGTSEIIPQEVVESKILFIAQFPEDFMFKLSKAERNELVTNCDRLLKVLNYD